MSNWTFVNREHKPEREWSREGKPEWAASLTLELSKKDALQLIAMLARLAVEAEGDDVIGVTLHGKLEEDVEDDE
jgi:hypothetical protein